MNQRMVWLRWPFYILAAFPVVFLTAVAIAGDEDLGPWPLFLSPLAPIPLAAIAWLFGRNIKAAGIACTIGIVTRTMMVWLVILSFGDWNWRF